MQQKKLQVVVNNIQTLLARTSPNTPVELQLHVGQNYFVVAKSLAPINHLSQNYQTRKCREVVIPALEAAGVELASLKSVGPVSDERREIVRLTSSLNQHKNQITRLQETQEELKTTIKEQEVEMDKKDSLNKQQKEVIESLLEEVKGLEQELGKIETTHEAYAWVAKLKTIKESNKYTPQFLEVR